MGTKFNLQYWIILYCESPVLSITYIYLMHYFSESSQFYTSETYVHQHFPPRKNTILFMELVHTHPATFQYFVIFRKSSVSTLTHPEFVSANCLKVNHSYCLKLSNTFKTPCLNCHKKISNTSCAVCQLSEDFHCLYVGLRNVKQTHKTARGIFDIPLLKLKF